MKCIDDEKYLERWKEGKIYEKRKKVLSLCCMTRSGRIRSSLYRGCIRSIMMRHIEMFPSSQYTRKTKSGRAKAKANAAQGIREMEKNRCNVIVIM